MAGSDGANNVIKRADVTIELPVAASISVTKGKWVEISSGYAVDCDTAESADVVGIAMTTVDNTSGSAGDKNVAVMTVGIANCECLVKDTDGSSGYDGDITVGKALFIGGDGSDDGQYVVAGDGTNAVAITAAKCVGMAMTAEAGSTDADTYSQLDVYVNVHGGI